MRILLHDITSHSMYQITLMTLFNRTRYSGRKLSTWDRGVNGQSPCSPRHQRNICLQGWVRWQWDGKNSHRRGFISFKLIPGHRQWCFIGHYTDPANSRRGEGAWRFNDYCYRLESSFSYRFRFHKRRFSIFFFVMVCIFGATHLFFSPDYVDSQRDLFLPRTSPKEKVFHYEWYSSLFYTSC